MNSFRNRRTAVWVAMIIGAIESETMLLNAGKSPSSLLVVLFSVWVLAPFAALAIAEVASSRWRPATQLALHALIIVIIAISLALYSRYIPMPAGSPNAFVFVATPPATLLALAFAFAGARIVTRNTRQ